MDITMAQFIPQIIPFPISEWRTERIETQRGEIRGSVPGHFPQQQHYKSLQAGE